ncbi:MAG: hypothetical protein Fur007_03330 [Rhodoferax sp.]
MTSSSADSFAKFVPGFEFLQNLAKGASQAVPQMPNLTQWVTPTINVEELDKRIAELKAVHFWLEQNARALGATVQALEVQKMTLATLKDMNFNLGDLANAFKLKAADTVVSGVQKVSDTASATVQSVADKASATAHSVADLAAHTEEAAKKAAALAKPAATAVAAGLVDPMNLWGALAQQFQHIAAGAMKEAGKATVANLGKAMDPDATAAAPKRGRKSQASASSPEAAPPAKASARRATKAESPAPRAKATTARAKATSTAKAAPRNKR